MQSNSLVTTVIFLSGLSLFSFLSPLWAQSVNQAVTIFDARKSLALSDDEVVYRDFYINAGREQGLQEGMVLMVTRQISLYDSFQNRSPGELRVEVGEVEIIHVQNGLSVAREHRIYGRESRPLLENNYIMLGDRLDLGSAQMKSAQASEQRDLDALPVN